ARSRRRHEGNSYRGPAVWYRPDSRGRPQDAPDVPPAGQVTRRIEGRVGRLQDFGDDSWGTGIPPAARRRLSPGEITLANVAWVAGSSPAMTKARHHKAR